VLRRAFNRVYSDLLLPDRLEEYRALLVHAREHGYEIHSIGSSRQAADGRRLVLRRDVDTDPGTARAMFEIERELGARASYFFRLSTVDPALMRSIEAHGGEAGYHFEELAAVAKERRLRSRDEVARHMPEIRARFRANLLRLRGETGAPLRVAAAHGDWMNRRLGMSNAELLDDALRRELAIDWEAYDAGLMPGRWRAADAPYPRFWAAEDPHDAIARGLPLVHVVTHPRHWRRNARASLREDLRRAAEGLRRR
jgi:hypothetical protein